MVLGSGVPPIEYRGGRLQEMLLVGRLAELTGQMEWNVNMKVLVCQRVPSVTVGQGLLVPFAPSERLCFEGGVCTRKQMKF
jgi:hypothetical protein